MPERRRPAKRNTTAYFIVAAVLIVSCVLTYGIIRSAGWLDRSAPLAQEPSREGRIPVPRSLVALKAFDKVQREDVYSLAEGEDSYFWLPQAQVEANPDWITRVDDIIGRVMARDKRADFVFSEKDFLPEGSRSGLAGGVPTGKQGFFLEAEKIPGLRFLKSGDRFDLLASLPEESTETGSEYGLLMGGVRARAGKPVPLSGVRILAQNAQMIALTTARDMTTQGGLNLNATDSRGRVTNNAREERVAIAIDPAEAVPLTQALGSKLDIHMVTRSGQETDQDADEDLLKGRIAVPATANALEAFQVVRGSDLAEPDTGELREYYFLPEDIRENWIVRPEQLIGRVLRRAVEPGYIFSEDDFLPPGSLLKNVQAYQAISAEDLAQGISSAWVGRIAARDLPAGTQLAEHDFLAPGATPGFAAAIPADRMALTIDTKVVTGAEELSRGDRCDLIASQTFDARKLNGIDLSPALASALSAQATNRLVAADALVMLRVDDQVVLAVDPDAVAEVTKAIALETPIFCIARAASISPPAAVANAAADAQRPAETPVLTSDPDPLSEISISETLIGGKRAARAYRRQP